MKGSIVTFGFENGTPPVTDVQFDVRDLTHDMHAPAAKAKLDDMVSKCSADQTISIGCKRGEHRSVVMGMRLAEKLDVPLTHRDAKVSKPKPKVYPEGKMY